VEGAGGRDDIIRQVTDARARQLRSTDTRMLTVHRTFSCFWDRTFAAAGTQVWNSLLSDLRKTELSYSQFRRSLETFLFGQSDRRALWTFLTTPFWNILTYLLSTFQILAAATGKAWLPLVASLHESTARFLIAAFRKRSVWNGTLLVGSQRTTCYTIALMLPSTLSPDNSRATQCDNHFAD